MIITYGDPSKEVEQFLGITSPLPAERAASLALVVEGVEAAIKTAIRREFEETSYTQYLSIAPGQVHLMLRDRPVTAWTKIETIDSWDSNGDPLTKTVVDRTSYQVDKEAGIVTLLSGSWTPGRYAALATYTAGYTATQITNNSTHEIRLAKVLILSVIAREWGLSKLPQRHLRSISTGDESVTLQVDFDYYQLRLIDALKLPQFRTA